MDQGFIEPAPQPVMPQQINVPGYYSQPTQLQPDQAVLTPTPQQSMGIRALNLITNQGQQAPSEVAGQAGIRGLIGASQLPVVKEGLELADLIEQHRQSELSKISDEPLVKGKYAGLFKDMNMRNISDMAGQYFDFPLAAGTIAGKVAPFHTKLGQFSNAPGFEKLPYSKGPDAIKQQLSSMARKGKLSQTEVNQVMSAIPEGTTLTPDDLRGYIDNHGVQVEVKRFGGDGGDAARALYEAEFPDKNWDNAGWTVQNSWRNEAQRNNPPNPTTYSDLTLPGGSNYREHVLTLPVKERPNSHFDERPNSHFDEWQKAELERAHKELNDFMVESGELPYDTPDFSDANVREEYTGVIEAGYWDDYAEQFPDVLDTPYQHPHWENIDNPAVHVRMDDRMIDGERTLFVTEVQSDMAAHNAGVVAAPKARKALQAFEAKLHGKYHVPMSDDMESVLLSVVKEADKHATSGSTAWMNIPHDRRVFLAEGEARRRGLIIDPREIHRATEPYTGGQQWRKSMSSSEAKQHTELLEAYTKTKQYEGMDAVPMPFDDGKWQDLAVQHILQEAADGDYARIAIITDAQRKSIGGLETYKGDMYAGSPSMQRRKDLNPDDPDYFEAKARSGGQGKYEKKTMDLGVIAEKLQKHAQKFDSGVSVGGGAGADDGNVFYKGSGSVDELMELVGNDEMLVSADGALKDGLEVVRTNDGYNLRDTSARGASDNPALTVTPTLRDNLKKTGQAIAGVGGLAVMQDQEHIQ